MLVHIDHGNYAMADKILAVLVSDGSAERRLRVEAKGWGQLVDSTAGGRTRSVIVETSGQVILSGVQPEAQLIYYVKEVPLKIVQNIQIILRVLTDQTKIKLGRTTSKATTFFG
jgi:regulator of extracellular matrix RemA (YlzA/DUF370 family)